MAQKSLFVRTRYVRITRLRRNRWHERLTDYLTKAESETPQIDEQDNYSFCRRLVNLAFEGWPDPYVAAFYYHYGRHPNKLIPEWLWREGKHRRLDIPDYDPTIELRIPPPHLGLMHQMSGSGWPDQYDTLRASQEEERASQPRIPPPNTPRFEGPNAFLEARNQYQHKYRQTRLAFNMCTQCRNPVCEESKCLCAYHLQREREARRATYMRKRLAMGKTVKHRKGWQDRQLSELVGLA